jgi:hypothetical protein
MSCSLSFARSASLTRSKLDNDSSRRSGATDQVGWWSPIVGSLNNVIVYILAPYIIVRVFSYDLTPRSVKVSLVGSLWADISTTPTTSYCGALCGKTLPIDIGKARVEDY